MNEPAALPAGSPAANPAAPLAGPALSLAMPCYNEEACIAETAPALVRAFERAGVELELILVDNGSTDRTGAIIDELIGSGLRIRKIALPVNAGYSGGIVRGLEACTAPIIGFVHADGQVAPDDVVMTYRLIEHRAPRVLAKVRRRFRQDSWKRKIVSIVYNGLMQVVFGWLGAIDINGSPKLFSRAAFARMRLESKDWFLDPEIIIKANRLGLRVIEIDVEGQARYGGASNVRPATIFEFLGNICRYRFGPRLRRWQRELKRETERATEGDPRREPSPASDSTPTAATAPGLGDVRVVEQRRFEDARGFLQKVLAGSQVTGGLPRGEIYVTAAKPGEVKGNHFHRRMGEWFAVVQGDGEVQMCDPSSGARRRVELGAARPRAVYVPAGIAHAVVNTGTGDLVCIACAEGEHDPSDVFAYPVGSPRTPTNHAPDTRTD